MSLLKVFAEIRAAGGRTPQVVFLTPFWDPPRVVAQLYADLYQLYRTLHDAFGTSGWSGHLDRVMKDLISVRERQRMA